MTHATDLMTRRVITPFGPTLDARFPNDGLDAAFPPADPELVEGRAAGTSEQPEVFPEPAAGYELLDPRLRGNDGDWRRLGLETLFLARTLGMGAVWMLVLLLSAGAALAGGLHVTVNEVDTQEFPRVRVRFDVKSFDRMPLRRLSDSDVRIVEEEVPIEQVEVRPHRAGLSLGLVVDGSGSVGPGMRYIKEALHHFIDRLDPYDEMAVVGFGRIVRPLQQLTTDPRLMKDAVSSVSAYGATPLLDGIAVGMHEAARGVGRQAVVVISDGREGEFPPTDPLSTLSPGQVIESARHHGAEIYTIGIGPHVNQGLLEMLACETGGLYQYSPDAADLSQLFEKIASGFVSSFEAVYRSPNIREDSLARGGLVDVHFQGHAGSAPYRYVMRPRTGTSAVSISRKQVWLDPHGKIRLVTRGIRQTFVPLEFVLLDSRRRPIRRGTTTLDGYGAPEGGGMPQLVELPPGTYELVLTQPGTELAYRHARIPVKAGKTTELAYVYSQLVLRRNGSLWYDTEHPLGETSDLVEIAVQQTATGRTLSRGPLSVFRHDDGTYLWLEQGSYRIRLDNLLGRARLPGQAAPGSAVPLPGVEPSVLRNAMTAIVSAKGGDVLFFDTAYADFLLDRDPRRVPRDQDPQPRAGEEPPVNRELARGHVRRPGHLKHRVQLRNHLEELVDESEDRAELFPSSRVILRHMRERQRSYARQGPLADDAEAAVPEHVMTRSRVARPPMTHPRRTAASAPEPLGPGSSRPGSRHPGSAVTPRQARGERNDVPAQMPPPALPETALSPDEDELAGLSGPSSGRAGPFDGSLYPAPPAAISDDASQGEISEDAFDEAPTQAGTAVASGGADTPPGTWGLGATAPATSPSANPSEALSERRDTDGSVYVSPYRRRPMLPSESSEKRSVESNRSGGNGPEPSSPLAPSPATGATKEPAAPVSSAAAGTGDSSKDAVLDTLRRMREQARRSRAEKPAEATSDVSLERLQDLVAE